MAFGEFVVFCDVPRIGGYARPEPRGKDWRYAEEMRGPGR